MLKWEDRQTKSQCVRATSNTTITATFTTITTLPKGMKVKFFHDFFFWGGGELQDNTSTVCRLSKGRNSNMKSLVYEVKTVGDVEQTKRTYF